MSTQIVLTLPDDVMQKATSWAGMMGRPVDDFLAQAVAATLNPLGTADLKCDLTSFSDAEVIAAVDMQLTGEEDRRLSELLHAQQAGKLANGAQVELQALMQIYQSQWLRKACALREAVRRGLREALEP